MALLGVVLGLVLHGGAALAGGKCRENPDPPEGAEWKVWHNTDLDYTLQYPPNWDMRKAYPDTPERLMLLSGHPPPGTKCGAAILASMSIERFDAANIALDAWITQKSTDAKYASKSGKKVRLVDWSSNIDGERAVLVRDEGADEALGKGARVIDTVFVKRGDRIFRFERAARRQRMEILDQVLRTVKLSCE